MQFGSLRLGLHPRSSGDNSPPTDITWAGSHVVEEGASVGTQIGGLVTFTDPDGGDGTFTLLDDSDGKVSIEAVSGTTARVLVASDIDFETHPSFDITIQVEDDGGATYQEQFTITSTDVLDGDEFLLLVA